MLDAGVPFVWWPCISQQIALECDKRLLVNTYTIATGDTANTISQANDMIWSVWIERESFFLVVDNFYHYPDISKPALTTSASIITTLNASFPSMT